MDLIALFGSENVKSPLTMGKSEKEIHDLGIPMRKIWTDFAKTGDVVSHGIDGMIEIHEIQKAERIPQA